MSKIRRIKLATTRITEHNGEFIEVKDNERELPAKITNFALKYGIDKGLIASSNLQELVKKIEEDFGLAVSIIYLGLVGADPTIIGTLKVEDVAEQLDYEWQDVTYIAQSVLLSGLPDTLDEFIAELESMTAPDTDDDNKKKLDH